MLCRGGEKKKKFRGRILSRRNFQEVVSRSRMFYFIFDRTDERMKVKKFFSTCYLLKILFVDDNIKKKESIILNISIFSYFLTFKFTTKNNYIRWKKSMRMENGSYNNGMTETFSVQVGFRWRKFNSDRGQFRVNRGEAETNEGV